MIEKNVIYACICHGRKSSLLEFQILPVESTVGGSTSRKSNLGYLGISL